VLLRRALYYRRRVVIVVVIVVVDDNHDSNATFFHVLRAIREHPVLLSGSRYRVPRVIKKKNTFRAENGRRFLLFPDTMPKNNFARVNRDPERDGTYNGVIYNDVTTSSPVLWGFSRRSV